MDRVTLKQLRYFDALARLGHFGHAADSCSVSQPALSVQIKEMELSLGAPLFERSARQVRLTRFGQDLKPRISEILGNLDDLDDFARAAQRTMTGRLRLGVIPTIAPYILPNVIAALTASFPDLDLYIRETMTSRLVEELQDGRIDTAILALPVSEPAFTEMPLFEEDFVLVRPQADADLPVPDGEALAKMRLLLLEEGHCFRDQALSFCTLNSALPRDGLDGSSLSTLVQMVGAGIGITLIPEMAMKVETRSAPVSVARFTQPTPKRTVGMIWRRTNPLADHLGAIADVVRKAAMPATVKTAADE